LIQPESPVIRQLPIIIGKSVPPLVKKNVGGSMAPMLPIFARKPVPIAPIVVSESG